MWFPNLCSITQIGEENRVPEFKVVSDFQPTGDQPEAIEQLVQGISEGVVNQTLLGATATGKTFTIANALKVFLPLIIVFPGLIAFTAFGPGMADDTIYVKMIREFLPLWGQGILLAVLIAAIMSTVSSVLNSSSTIWSMFPEETPVPCSTPSSWL